jgi:hypothetical protein
MKRYLLLLFTATSLLVSCTRGNPDITTEELYSHISFLASDRLEGRMTGTEGDSLAALYIRNELLSYGLVPFVDDGFQRFRVNNRIAAGTRNVVMVLPGNDPVLKDEFLVIGAHYDHLGYGGEGSSSRMPDTIAVHYGADDNASGIAMMLELAEKFAYKSEGNARSIVFAAFSAEEIGLLGAKHFVDNMPVSHGSVNAMINLDMVGRLKESLVLQVGGAGTAKGIKELLAKSSDTTSLKMALSDEGYGPSDHSAFYVNDIPVIFVSTGPHLDYHTPFDTKDSINLDGMIVISEFIYTVAEELAGRTEKLAFTEAGPRQGPGHGTRSSGVTLGIMPDVSGTIKNGLRADFVIPERPAALGGMQKGDVIKSINGKPVNNIEDYMESLNQLKQGETITVEILRKDITELLIIQL